MPLNLHRLAGLAAVGLICYTPMDAYAEPIVASPGSETEALAGLTTGDQLILDGFTGTLAFAGSELALDNFSGLLGFSSASAYVVTIAGHVRSQEATASRGRMLVIAPLGQGVVSERFDAQRLHDALADSPRATEFHTTLASLENLANRQDTGVFIGRLTRTNFNVATFGSAEEEQARRSVLGDDAVRKIRFSSYQDSVAIEAALARRFAEALRDRDAKTLASLLDPTPFGGTDLRGGALAARSISAQRLIDSNNWSEALENVEMVPQGEPGLWRFAAPNGVVTVATRPVGEFIFVTSTSLDTQISGVRP